MSENKEKVCTCPAPVVGQELPVGFRGRVICGKCKGVYDFSKQPKPEEYKGSDPVKKMLHAYAAQSQTLSVEMAALTIMVEIRELLKELVQRLALQRK